MALMKRNKMNGMNVYFRPKMEKWLLLGIGILGLCLLQACSSQNPQVIIETELGNITLEIFEDSAPITAGNFLRYIDEDIYEDLTFYRIQRPNNQVDRKIVIEVIQGGFRTEPHPNSLPPISHETTKTTKILHETGVISMTRDKPGSASSDFFICMSDQPELDFGGMRNPDGQGFAAFGKVIKGMDIAHKIYQRDVNDEFLTKPVKILDIRRI